MTSYSNTNRASSDAIGPDNSKAARQALARSLPPAPGQKIWNEILKIGDLPILEETRQRVHYRLRDAQVSFKVLAPLVEQDPALCLNLQRRAVVLNPTCRAQITGAASCLSLLGFSEVVHTVKRLPVIERNSQSTQEQHYRLGLQLAAFAGNLAAKWSNQKASSACSQARWNCMLASAPLWVWLLKEPMTQNWLHLISLGWDPVQALQAVFGKRLNNWQKLAAKLSLPPQSQDLWRPDRWPTQRQWPALRRRDPRDRPPSENRALVHLCQQPTLGLILFNQLSLRAFINPFDVKTRRWMALTANGLGRPPYLIDLQFKDTSLTTARQLNSPVPGGVGHWLSSTMQAVSIPRWYPDQEKPEHNSAPQPQPKSLAQPETSSTPNTKAEQTQEHLHSSITQNTSGNRPTCSNPVSATANQEAPETAQARLQKRLSGQPGIANNWHSLMQALVDTLVQDSGNEFAMAWVVNKQRTELKLAYAQGEKGLSGSIPPMPLQTPKNGTTLFGKLISQRASIMVTPSNRAKLLSNLPDSIQQSLPDTLMLMSFDAGRQPIGIIMAGTTSTTEQSSASNLANYGLFKQLCQQTCVALKQLRLSNRSESHAPAPKQAPRPMKALMQAPRQTSRPAPARE